MNITPPRIRLGVCFALCWSLAAAAQEPAGVVSRYLPASAEHTIERADGTRVIVALGSPVFAGDEIDVLDGGTLVLSYADGDSETLAGTTRFTVPDKAPLGFMASVFGRLQGVLGRQYRQGANLATRGDGSCDGGSAAELTVPALGDLAQLGPGHEDLSLAWVGGCAPYAWTLAGGGKQYAAEGLPRPQGRIATPGLGPGDYTLTISDADGRAVTSRVIVRERLPEAPFDAAAGPGELAAVAYAAWLAEHEAGQWRWESFQFLRPFIRGGSTMAGTYGDVLLWGDPSPGETDAAH